MVEEKLRIKSGEEVRGDGNQQLCSKSARYKIERVAILSDLKSFHGTSRHP